MAIKLYLSTNPAPAGIVPSTHASWDVTTDLVRYSMQPTKQNTAMTTMQWTKSEASQTYYLIGQWISPPMAAGAVFVPSVSLLRSIARWAEDNLDANGFVQSHIKVVSQDGTTTRFAAGFNTDANEFNLTTLQSRVDTRSSAAADYTTVEGDRCVLEYGFRKNSAAARTISLSIGDDAVNDLAVGDTDTDADNPYFNLPDIDGSFLPETGAGQLMLTGCGR